MVEEKNRRCYENGLCPFHKLLEDQAKKALPKWVFILFLTAFGLFSGWYAYSLAGVETKIQTVDERFHQIKIGQVEIQTNLKNITKLLEQHRNESRKFRSDLDAEYDRAR